MATRKPKTTAVVSWEAEMAAAANKGAAAEKASGGFKSIGLRSGILSVDDNPVPDNELRCIVLVSSHENQHYDGPFNPNVLQNPTCYAFGDVDSDDPEEGMAPHPDVKEPLSDSCATCWANEMGSAETGRGKACKNIRRLILVTEDALESADNMAEAEVRALKVPVTSVKNWSKYLHKLNEEVQRPAWGVITLIKVVPDAKSQFKVQFSFEELVNFDQELYDATQSRIKEIKRDVVQPYQDIAVVAPPPSRRGAAPAKGKPAPAKAAPARGKKF